METRFEFIPTDIVLDCRRKSSCILVFVRLRSGIVRELARASLEATPWGTVERARLGCHDEDHLEKKFAMGLKRREFEGDEMLILQIRCICTFRIEIGEGRAFTWRAFIAALTR